MKILQADKWHKIMDKEEVEKFLEKPLIMRLGLIDKDGYPLVHPVWFHYKDSVFYVLSNKESKKVSILKANPKVYFTIDMDKPIGVRGKGDAILIDNKDLAVELMKSMIIRYLGDLNKEISKSLLEDAKESMIIKIVPRFLATWKYK